MTNTILQCLPLLADILGRAYGVVVEVGGDTAFTTGRVIRLPSLPASGDAVFLGLVRGYIDHEAAHVRHTDFGAMNQAVISPLEKHVWNTFEDWRVENHLAARFPGCRANFDWLIRHLFLHRQSEQRPAAFVILDWLLLTVRSWNVPDLQPQCQAEANQIDRAWPGLRVRLDAILATMQGHCPDSLACLDYARQVVLCLQTYQQVRKKPPATGRNAPGSVGASDSPANAGGSDLGSGSCVGADAPDLRALVDAKEGDLPEDLGQFLGRSMAEETVKPGRCTVATIGEKRMSALGQQDLADIQHVTAGLKARLQGLVQATRLVRRMPAAKGRIDPRRLHGIATGESHVFLAYERKPAINTAVHILLDASASMRERIGLAGQCCFAIARVMKPMGISVGVTAFPGHQPATVVPILRHGDRVHHAMVVEAKGMTPLAESLWWVLQRLARLKEQRRIVVIVTDGSPDNLLAVQAAVAGAMALGVEIHGLGIDAPQIRNFLPRTSQSITGLPELPVALFSMLASVLTQRRIT